MERLETPVAIIDSPVELDFCVKIDLKKTETNKNAQVLIINSSFIHKSNCKKLEAPQSLTYKKQYHLYEIEKFLQFWKYNSLIYGLEHFHFLVNNYIAR